MYILLYIPFQRRSNIKNKWGMAIENGTSNVPGFGMEPIFFILLSLVESLPGFVFHFPYSHHDFMNPHHLWLFFLWKQPKQKTKHLHSVCSKYNEITR